MAQRVAILAALLVILPSGGASASRAANDFAPGLAYTALVSTPSAKTTESLGFQISPLLSSDGGEPVTVELRVKLPAGIHWAGKAPGAAEGCTRTEDEAVCTKNVTPTSGTNLAATYGLWPVVAERAGSYTIEASMAETSQPDPNPSNDSSSLVVNVRNTLGGVTLKPRPLKAGSDVVASHAVFTLDNEGRTFPLSNGAVTCSAKIGSVKAKSLAAFSGGRATCRVKTPKGAKGKLVTGTIRTTAAGLALTKQFNAKLR